MLSRLLLNVKQFQCDSHVEGLGVPGKRLEPDGDLGDEGGTGPAGTDVPKRETN